MSQELDCPEIHQAVDLICNARYMIAFTGAGISTESGIPDFRSHDSGLWQGTDPMEVASIHGFKRNPQAFYDWVRPLSCMTAQAQPNQAHYALAEMETRGILKSVITQNIDMLHTRAGTRNIYELHGHLRQATCINCFAVLDGETV
ncbi:MAG TPA: Sir2 family NAD-dependent protein deacetylase, partial [Phototrophicaceae bacterium]|nr:Sir2 family NAD-dependent protein deacetylase [Phototrophicaceae bacterium]